MSVVVTVPVSIEEAELVANALDAYAKKLDENIGHSNALDAVRLHADMKTCQFLRDEFRKEARR